MKDDLPFIHPSLNHIPLPVEALENIDAQGIEESLLNGTLERTRSVNRVVTLIGDKLPGLRLNGKPDTLSGQATSSLKLYAGNLTEFLPVQTVKDHSLIHPVQKLGPEVRPQRFEDLGFPGTLSL